MTPSAEPIAAPVTPLPALLRAPAAVPGVTVVRVTARALAGMLKEAVVSRDGSDAGWRFLCDEGPYLNGTDLAPPPLAYFAAGMAAHHAALLETRLDGAEPPTFKQVTRYTMDGSALKGTMTGGALPVIWALDGGVAHPQALEAAARAALARSGAEDLMARPRAGTFSLTANGERIATGRARATDAPVPDAPWSALDAVRVDDSGDWITKQENVVRSDDATHGAGASLRESQRRELNLLSTCTPGSDGLSDIAVHLRQPVGSQFGFTARRAPDAGGPDGLDLLCAGIALCFLTQMGRYATITKSDLSRYAVIQDAHWEDGGARLASLTTHAYLDSREDADTCRRFVDMSEQTCFLHAATRSANPTVVSVDTHTKSQG